MIGKDVPAVRVSKLAELLLSCHCGVIRPDAMQFFRRNHVMIRSLQRLVDSVGELRHNSWKDWELDTKVSRPILKNTRKICHSVGPLTALPVASLVYNISRHENVLGTPSTRTAEVISHRGLRSTAADLIFVRPDTFQQLKYH